MSERVNEEQTFEALLQQFDDIVSSLESNDLSLDEAIAKYELAASLAQRCSDILESAELRVRQIDEVLDSNNSH